MHSGQGSYIRIGAKGGTATAAIWLLFTGARLLLFSNGYFLVAVVMYLAPAVLMGMTLAGAIVGVALEREANARDRERELRGQVIVGCVMGLIVWAALVCLIGLALGAYPLKAWLALALGNIRKEGFGTTRVYSEWLAWGGVVGVVVAYMASKLSRRSDASLQNAI